MINRIFSDLATFKSLEFRPGLNILLADKHEKSTSRDTRNGTGKTSVIELLHFLVQDRKNPSDDFHKEALVGHTFGAEFAGDSGSLTIERTAGEGSTKDTIALDGKPVDARELREKLANIWFGLTPEVLEQSYSPKFGALLSYFLRKERNGGFNNPALNASQQNSWDSQVNLAYLLGFDWKLIQRLQVLKDQKKATDTVAKMLKAGFFSDGSLDLNKMQARLDLLENEVEKRRDELSRARVLDGYEEIETDANELSVQIRMRNEANLSDLDLIESISAALAEVESSNLRDVVEIYEQAGLFFPDQVRERFENVEKFHAQVSENRKAQLDAELNRAEARLKARRSEIRELEQRLAAKMRLLSSNVAIDRYSRIQSELHNLEAELGDLRQQVPRLRDVQETKERLKREIDEQVDLIGHDVQERGDARKFAVQAFAEVSSFLYDQPGSLILGRSRGIGGLEIDTDILGKKSGGKSHMQIFCFDWVLVQAALRQQKFPGFLFHDSHIFDGVDGRQIGLALAFAAKKSEELGIQYIIAMNSDDVEKMNNETAEDGSALFDPAPYVMPTRLSDEENGGLFGVRF